jgi:hypothetical protein
MHVVFNTLICKELNKNMVFVLKIYYKLLKNVAD